MLYLVNCEVRKSYYMRDDDDDEKETITHIVEANSEKEAEEKVKKHYESKDDAYSLTHWVYINYCNEMIR